MEVIECSEWHNNKPADIDEKECLTLWDKMNEEVIRLRNATRISPLVAALAYHHLQC